MKSSPALLSLLFLLLTALTACSGNTPARAAEKWLTAVNTADGAAALKLTCAQYQSDVQITGFLTTGLGMMAGIDVQDVETDLSDLTFETVSESGDTAVVRVEGEMVTSFMGAALPQPVNTSFQMIKEDGDWKWCGMQ